MMNEDRFGSSETFRKLTPEKVLKSPPMGWNSWDCFGASVTEDEVRENARYIHDHLKEYGWEYVVVDIQWYEPTADGWDYHNFYPLTLDEYGRLQPALNRFPSAAGGKGFKPLADYVHSLGLKFGLHIMRGIPRQAVHQNLPIRQGEGYGCRDAAAQASICKWNTDMYGTNPSHPAARAWYDALYRQFADWTVDYVKVDDIAWNFIAEDHYPAEEVELISRAIHKTGRPMVLSLSPGPAVFEKREHLMNYAHMWRMTDDFWDEWPLLQTVMKRCHEWSEIVGDGNWPDADMLPLGFITNRQGRGHMTRFTRDEQRLVMNLWSIFRSPLMMGGDLRRNDDWTLGLLTNKRLLAFNQNGGKPKELTYNPDGLIVWTQITGEGQANGLLLINASDETRTVTLDLAAKPWRELGLFSLFLCNIWEDEDQIECEEGKPAEIKLKARQSRFYYFKEAKKRL